MPDPNFLLLYVESPAASEKFYAELLDKAAVESHPTFAAFALESGMMLGLWSKHTVAPPATPAGGSEIAFTVADEAAVEALHTCGVASGVTIIQPPTQMDFGFAFTAADPDGHRLRVFAPREE